MKLVWLWMLAAVVVLFTPIVVVSNGAGWIDISEDAAAKSTNGTAIDAATEPVATTDSSPLCVHTSRPNHECVPTESCNASLRAERLRCDAEGVVCCLGGSATREERESVNKAVTSGLEQLEKRDELEKVLVIKDLMVKPYTTEGMYNEYMNSDDKALDAERNSFVMVQAVKYLSFKDPNQNNVSDAIQRFMSGNEGSLDELFASLDLPIGDQIPPEMQSQLGIKGGVSQTQSLNSANLTSDGSSGDFDDANRESQTRRGRSYLYGGGENYGCTATKYRTIDGGCNNLKNPDWGRAFRVYNRLLAAKYSDGVASPRTSYDGTYLPSARLISTTICTDEDHLIHDNTLMSMQWGQFVDHEMGFTPIYKARGTHGILCCAKEIYENPHLLHPECFPIAIPENDPFYRSHYGEHRTRCLEFVRSLAGPTAYGNKYGGKRQQLNQVSSFIDGSVIYGSSHRESKILRSFRNGQLKTITRYGKEYVPQEINPHCTDQSLCHRVISGDSRANQHPWLTVLHNIFFRAHNWIAYELHLINPHWDDNYLYEETRRIINAQMQHITYNEFLPSFFGYGFLKQYGLDVKRYGYSNDYDEYINPTSLNEFTASAFRVGHSLIHGTIEYRSREYGNGNLGKLREHYFSPHEILENGIMDKYILSLITQWPQRVDVWITKEVTNYLFKAKNESHGLDLISMNIQRGRDHGLQPYNEYRKLCGLNKAYDFDDLYPSIDRQVIDKLKYLYKTVNDIDLYIGGIAERHNRYSLLGPTFACIIANQFRRVKRGDRFWYEIGYQPNSFTPDQLQEIRRTTLGSIICHFSDRIEYVQKFVFKQPYSENPVASCKDYAIHQRPDLTKWRQVPGKQYSGPGASYGGRAYNSGGSYGGPAYDSGGSYGDPAYDNSKRYGVPAYDSGYKQGDGPEYGSPQYGSPGYEGGDSYKAPDKVYITKGSYEGPASQVQGYYGGGPGYGPGGPGKYTTETIAPAYDSVYSGAEYNPGYSGSAPLSVPINVPDVDKLYIVPPGDYGGDSYDSESTYKSESSYDSTIPYGKGGGAAYDSAYDGGYANHGYSEGDDGKSGPYARSLPYGGGYGVDYGGGYGDADKSEYASASKASYDSSYKASADKDKSKSAYYDSGATSYDKSADAYDASKDAYAKKGYAQKHSEKDYYDKDAIYTDRKYSANRRYYASKYGSSKGYDDSVYSADKYTKYAAKSDHKEYDAAADKKATSYDASAYGAKTYTDSSAKSKDAAYKISEHDDKYKVASKGSYDSDAAYTASEKYEKPNTYIEKPSYYDAGYKGGADYDAGYKGGADYDAGYKGGAVYDAGYKGGADYDAGYKGGAVYDAGYKGGAVYDAGYKGGAVYDAGYKGGADYDAGYKGGADYDAGYKGGADYDAGYKGGAVYDAGYKGGAVYDAGYKGGAVYDAGYKGGAVYDAGYRGSGYDASYKGSGSGYDADGYKGSAGYDAGYKRGAVYDAGYKDSVYDASYKGSDYDGGYTGSGSAYDSSYSGPAYDSSKYNPGYGSGSSYDSSYSSGGSAGYDSYPAYGSESGYSSSSKYGGPSYDSSYSSGGPSYDPAYIAPGDYGGSRYGGGYGYDPSYTGGYDPSYGGSGVVYESGYSGGSSYGGPSYETGYKTTASYGKPGYDASYSSGPSSYGDGSKYDAGYDANKGPYKSGPGYGTSSPAYGGSKYGSSPAAYRGSAYAGGSDYKGAGYRGSTYGDRYARSHNDTEDTEFESEDSLKNVNESEIIVNYESDANHTDAEDDESVNRDERSPGYYVQPNYDSSAHASKASYDSAYKASADRDKAKSSYSDSDVRYYDKEADKYGKHSDSYYGAAYAKKHSEDDYYDKDAAYRDRKYGARRRYYASNYGARKGYDDASYSQDKYAKKHAASDHKEYDAAADKKSSSYDASAYAAKYKVDDYDKKTDSGYYDKEYDAYYKANTDSSYKAAEAAQKESKPTYTAPKAPNYDRAYASYGSGSEYYGRAPAYRGQSYKGGNYDRYPRSHDNETEATSEFNNGNVTEEQESPLTNSNVGSAADENDDRQERSYGEYGYPEQSYAASAYASKASYDSADRSSAAYDKAKSSYADSDVKYYDKEADIYGRKKDSYDAAAYAKKYSEADYYDKDAAYGERKYGAKRKYYDSKYGDNKGYEDASYTSNRYSKLHAASDRKEYDAAADKKASSYDASSYAAKYKVDDYDKKADSAYYAKESEDKYKASKESSYKAAEAAQRESRPTYSAPKAPSYDSVYDGPTYESSTYGGYGKPQYGSYDGPDYRSKGYDERYPRSHDSQESNATVTVDDDHIDVDTTATPLSSETDESEEITIEN